MNCTGTTVQACTECAVNFSLYGTTCYDICPDGFWSDASGSGSICQNCHSDCLSCSGPWSNDCDVCAFGLFMNPKSNSCITSCENELPGYYSLKSEGKCA